jgi:DNA-binding NtrC family response regulator
VVGTQDLAVSNNQQAVDTPEAPSSPLTILIVDDDKDVCEYLQDFLTADGYSVSIVNDPTQALETLREREFHVAVLDLMMPKLSGIDLLEQIRRADDDIAVILHTGYPSRQTAPASRGHELAASLRNPGTCDEFRDALARIAKKKGLVLRREDELHLTIGRNIRELRKERGLTLKQMSRRTKLSVSLLSQIERAESSASVSSLFKVATALDVKITELFGQF